MQEVFPSESRPASQPVNFVDGREAAALLIHGGSDTTVSAENARSLAARIEAAGGQVDLAILERTGHARLALALAPPLRFLAPAVLDQSAAFIRSQAKVHASTAGL